MAEEQDHKPLNDFALTSDEELHTSILNHAITAHKFEPKPALLQIV